MKQRSKILTALFLSASLAVTPAASVSVLAENLDVAAVEDVTVVPEEEISDSTDDSDLTEDMAAEQKARTTYDNILALSKNEDVNKVIRFLREREIVHYQRFAEGLEYVKSQLNKKNYYAYNPSFTSSKREQTCE